MTWPTVKLADHCDTITKGTTPTSLGFSFAEAGIPFVRVQNLVDGAVKFQPDDLFIDEETHKALRRSVIVPGDLLISIAGTIGRCGIVPDGVGELNCNQAVAIVRPKATIDRRFLLHWISSREALDQISQSKVTATISNLSLGQIGNLKVALPPLAEQKRIAAILDQADALRRKRQHSLDRLSALGQAIFHEMFGHSLGGLQNLDQCLADACLKITDGTHHSPKIQEHGVPYITAKHLRPDGLDFFSNPWFISHADHAEIFSRCNPEKDDVLYIKDGATTGIAAINEYHFPFSMLSSLALLKINPSVCLPQYVCAWLNSPVVKKYMTDSMSGAGITRLTLAKIKSSRFFIPKMQDQEKFSHLVDKINAKKCRMQSSLSQTTALFQSLQHRAFRGEL